MVVDPSFGGDGKVVNRFKLELGLCENLAIKYFLPTSKLDNMRCQAPKALCNMLNTLFAIKYTIVPGSEIASSSLLRL